MDIHDQQPDVRRRLDFEDVEMRTPDGLPREGSGGNSPLSGDGGTTASEDSEGSVGTDQESPFRTEDGLEIPGVQVLYQGHGRPQNIRVPPAGLAAVLYRAHDGTTVLFRIPVGRLQVAFDDDQEHEERVDPEV